MRELQDYIVEIRHVGFVVPDLKAALADLQRVYGVADSEISIQPGYEVDTPTRFALVTMGNTEYEYIEPLAEPYRSIIESTACGGAGINHVAWRISDMEGAMAALAAKGIKPGYVTPDGPVAMGNRKMVYLDPATTGNQLIELIEDPDAPVVARD